MEKEYIVTKSNKLIGANYDLSLQEQKIILTLASMVQPQDTEFQEYEFKIKDFIELLGLKDQSKYTELPKITRELKKKVFEIKEGTDILQVSWLGGVRYKTKEGTLILSLDKGLKPYMLQLKELYTSYKLENVLSLKSKYSIRLYEILKSNLFKKQVIVELEELKSMLGAKEKSYSVYQNFKNKAILQAQKELKTLTDINFDFEEIKTGRKVTSIRFYIHSNNKKVINKTTALDEVSATIEVNEEMNMETGTREVLKILHGYNVEPINAFQIYKNANGDIKHIKKVYEYSKTQHITNLIGFMKTMVIPGVLQESIKSSKELSFNNFEQRAYDGSDGGMTFDEMEQKLLGWDD